MKKLTAVIAMVLSLGAFATEQSVEVTIFGNEAGWTQSYYNCDYVEDTAKSLLKKLGATDISARCTGGLDPWMRIALPATVRSEFNLPVVTGETTEVVKIRGRDCVLNTKLMKSFLKVFTNVEVIKARTSCFGGSNDSFSYELKVTR